MPGSTAPAIVDPAGRRWHQVEADIGPGRARALVAGGAVLAWDDCGSLGYAAPVTWITKEDAARLAADGPPTLRVTKRHDASLTAWQTEDGSWLVLASMSVRWGALMA